MICRNFVTIAFLHLTILTGINIGQLGEVSDPALIWKTRADSILTAIAKDADKESGLRRSLIFARMGEALWTTDPDQSNLWYEKAVDTLIYKVDSEEKDQSELFYQTARDILKLVSARNRKQSDRVLRLLSESDKVSEKNKSGNADSLIDLALSIAKDDPARAFEIGGVAFRVGQPGNYYKLYWELNRRSPDLADRFYRTFFSATTARPDAKRIASLKTAVFPEFDFPNAPNEIKSSAANRLESLNFFVDHIARLYLQFAGKSISSCRSEALLIAPLRQLVSTLTPQKVTIADQALETCLKDGGSKEDKSTSAPNLQNADSIEEFVRLADEAKNDLATRSYYLFRAAALANTKNRYSRGIEILEGMSKEERETDFSFWGELRYTLAAGLAYLEVQSGEVAGARRTLDQVTASHRAYAKITFALKFSLKEAAYRPFVVERLQEARTELAKLETEFNEKRGFWFRLIGIFSDYGMPTEAGETFDDLVKAFNKTGTDTTKKASSITSEMIRTAVSPRLFESQEFSLQETVEKITDVKTRIDVRFGFLSTVLKEYGTLKSRKGSAVKAGGAV